MRMKDRHRKLARERFWGEHDKDSYRCPDCGRKGFHVGEFEVHHINGDPHDNRLENLVALCEFCHCLREDRKPPIKAIKRMRDYTSLATEEWKLKEQSSRQYEGLLREATGLSGEDFARYVMDNTSTDWVYEKYQSKSIHDIDGLGDHWERDSEFL